MEEKTAVFSLTGKCGHSILVFSSEALWSTQSSMRQFTSGCAGETLQSSSSIFKKVIVT